MKRITAVVLLAVMLLTFACAQGETVYKDWAEGVLLKFEDADVTAQLDYAALERFVQACNQDMAEAGVQIKYSLSDEGEFYSLGGDYWLPEAERFSILDSFTGFGEPASLMMGWTSFDSTLAFIYDEAALLEIPQKAELYINGSSSGIQLDDYPAQNPQEVNLRTVRFTLEQVRQICAADDVFIRLTTDKGTYFQEMSAEAAPIAMLMMYAVVDGMEYSLKSSENYLNPDYLWTEPVSATAAPAPTAAPALPFQNDYEAIDRAAQSVFLLEVYDEKDELVATGSGFVAFDQGTLITNEHVIEDAAYIVAYSDQYAASYRLTELKAADEDKDIAILGFDASAHISPLAVDLQSRVLRGQPVTAIGSPQGVINTVSSGNISNVVYYCDAVPDAIQFTAPISPGSSGGALFNERGSVIGLCASGLREGDAMYYAIPMKYVEEMYLEARGRQSITLAQYNELPDSLPATKLAKPKLGDGCIELKWSEVKLAHGYEIYRRNEHQIEFELLSISDDTFYSDYSVEFGMGYEYCVYPLHDWRKGEYSNTVTFVMTKVTPAPKSTPTPTPAPEGKVLYKKGDTNKKIIDIKLRLFELGYYVGGEGFNNQFHAILESSVRAFQKNNYLTQSGKIDDITLERLFGSDPIQGFYKGGRVEVQKYSEREYELNDTGRDVLMLKERLKELGYYELSVKFDDRYDKTMVARVKTFQKNNKLKQTGKIDYITLIKMYDDIIIAKGQWYVKSIAISEQEKKIALEITEDCYGDWKEDGDELFFRLQVKNVSKHQTVKAYELFFYTLDKEGNVLQTDNTVCTQYVESTIEPDQKEYTTYTVFPNKDEIDRVYVAIHKVKYLDGTEKREISPEYVYWIID